VGGCCGELVDFRSSRRKGVGCKLVGVLIRRNLTLLCAVNLVFLGVIDKSLLLIIL
jgi:hypothetical protein